MLISRALVILCLVLSGCTSPNTHVSSVHFGGSDALVTTGNIRLVTERKRAGFPPVVCTEPSPDYAIAFNNSRKVTVNVTRADTSAATGDVDLSSTETVETGAGRAAAVLALRDGLSTACQSYANGVIGHDAYAMILSQYGMLLVALVGNQPAAAADPAATGRQATLSALLVACISSHDRTRVGGPTNSLLDTRFCSEVLSRALLRATRI